MLESHEHDLQSIASSNDIVDDMFSTRKFSTSLSRLYDTLVELLSRRNKR